MPRTRLAILAAVAAPILLVGCGSQEASTSAGATSPGANPSNAVSFQPPTDAQKTAVIAALTAIDPALTTSADTAIFHAMSTCDDLRIVKDRATVVAYAADRYRGTGADVDTAKAARIVDAISTAYCKV
ncbi:hypothetical protein LO772_01580 [Yinghuangia sp. ASG 101]|uniref:hypothetical protein n=1 Tax=Yinghuangia sp. ASG 101 TaxID=2896848 RepID=UPI001E36C89F|nr:hypothetical protein [Yinghuangia sp. ASG 101]UGQ12330.1 hypothetical protein LO772_01580 [Yinghuangia sp. ASG 101]